MKYVVAVVVVLASSFWFPLEARGAEAGAAPGTGAPAATRPVTVEEAQALVKQIRAGAARGDLSAFQNAVDDEEIINRALAGLTLKPSTRAGFRDGAKIAAPLAKAIQTQIQNGATYRPVRIILRDGQPRPLFRLVSAQGLNYHELVLVRDKKGQVRIGDLLIYLIGETMSQNLHNSFLLAVAKDGSVKLDATQRDFLAAIPKLAQIRQLLASQKEKEALALFEGLPAGAKEMKSVALVGVMVRANAGDDEKYLAAIDAYRKKFPGAADVELISLDALYLRKDFDGVLATIARLDKQLGGDPYLDLYRANAVGGKGDVKAARQYQQKLLTAYPDMPTAYFAAIEFELGQKNFDQVARLLTDSTKKAGVPWADLSRSESFAEFIKSPAYAKWKASAAASSSSSSSTTNPPAAGK